LSSIFSAPIVPFHKIKYVICALPDAANPNYLQKNGSCPDEKAAPRGADLQIINKD
jgi:hypothetical protein